MKNIILGAALAIGLCSCQGSLSAINAQGARFDIERLYGSPPAEIAALARRSPGIRAVYEASREHGIDPAFMMRVAKRESGGACNLTSVKGARGVLQVMPGTAKKHGVSARDLLTCKGSAKAGVKEMVYLLKKYGDKRKALIAYNCGEGCISRKKLPRETKRYIAALNH